MAQLSGIYKIVNEVNGKYYIGSSKNVWKRWNTHISKLNNKLHPNLHFQNAWHKYGKDSFKFYIIEETADLSLREQYYLDIAKLDKNNCYNVSYLADRIDMTSEIKEKISSSLKGKYVGDKHPFFGKKHSDISRKKISTSQIGRISPNRGISLSVEQKEKIRYTLLQQRDEISSRNSKLWKFVSPNGDIIDIFNLNEYCKTNNLQVSKMCEVAHGNRLHHKGWRKAN